MLPRTPSLALPLTLALIVPVALLLTQVDGNTSVLVRGRGFRSVAQRQPQCKFGSTRVFATILSRLGLPSPNPLPYPNPNRNP